MNKLPGPSPLRRLSPSYMYITNELKSSYYADVLSTFWVLPQPLLWGTGAKTP